MGAGVEDVHAPTTRRTCAVTALAVPVSRHAGPQENPVRFQAAREPVDDHLVVVVDHEVVRSGGPAAGVRYDACEPRVILRAIVGTPLVRLTASCPGRALQRGQPGSTTVPPGPHTCRNTTNLPRSAPYGHARAVTSRCMTPPAAAPSRSPTSGPSLVSRGNARAVAKTVRVDGTWKLEVVNETGKIKQGDEHTLMRLAVGQWPGPPGRFSPSVWSVGSQRSLCAAAP